MNLRRDDDKRFLPWFAREMWTVSEGVTRDCWRNVATWARKSDFMTHMTFEVELDEVLSKPMNALYYAEKPGYPSGFNIRELPAHVHGI